MAGCLSQQLTVVPPCHRSSLSSLDPLSLKSTSTVSHDADSLNSNVSTPTPSLEPTLTAAPADVTETCRPQQITGQSGQTATADHRSVGGVRGDRRQVRSQVSGEGGGSEGTDAPRHLQITGQWAGSFRGNLIKVHRIEVNLMCVKNAAVRTWLGSVGYFMVAR